MRNVVLGLALTLSSISVAAAPQQPANVCEMFTAADVAAVIGAGAQPGRQLIPGSCVWAGKGISLTIARVDAGEPGEALALVDAVKGRGQKGDQVRDESGLGQRAVSTVAGNKRGVSLIAADGKLSWNLSVESGDQALDTTAILAKLRTLLKKGMKP